VDGAQMNHIVRPTGRDGEDQEWTLFGIALVALVEQFVELDPEWEDTGAELPRAQGSATG